MLSDTDGVTVQAPRLKLPFELYSQILEYLPLQNLLEATIACREFQMETETIIYRKITMTFAWLRGTFNLFKRALLSDPRRQSLVKEVHYAIHGPAHIIEPWTDTFKFCLSTLPNLKFVTIPSIESEPASSGFWMGVKARLEVVHVHSIEIEDNLELFYSNQDSIKEFSLSTLRIREHPRIAHFLPNLDSIGGAANIIRFYAPGHPITKVSLSWVLERSYFRTEVLPFLQQSTASITHLRFLVMCLTPQDLHVVADGLPSLRVLQITDAGDAYSPVEDEPTLKERIIELNLHPSLPFETVRPEYTEYPHFIPTFVDALFGPLARFRDLEQFQFQYSEASEIDVFTIFDLSQCLRWRDTATPNLRVLRLNHITLIKADNGVWTQRRMTDWSVTERGKPFSWRE